MADNMNFDDPFASVSAQAEAQMTEEISGGAQKKEAEPVKIDDSMLSDAEKKLVEDFSEKIDLTDSSAILQFGSAAQQKVAGFSDSALQNVRVKDFGKLGDEIAELVVKLKDIPDGDEKKGFLGIFSNTKRSIETMKARYDKAEGSVNSIVSSLEKHQITLLKDVSMLDKMYEMNLAYFKELTMYILAGKRRLEHERTVTLPELKKKAADSGKAEDAQAANDFEEMCTRFEKKLYDLELTRMISVQMAPQIRLVQNNDTMMSEKIQSTIVNTIPLWKSQMVISLGIAHSTQAMEAQRSVTEMTNELLKKNADALKTGTVEIAKESERGIVDIETLTETNQKLIETLDEVQRIQAEGHEKRVAAEAELSRIEGELKTKLLSIDRDDNAQNTDK